jgi:hypothetical protein
VGRGEGGKLVSGGLTHLLLTGGTGNNDDGLALALCGLLDSAVSLEGKEGVALLAEQARAASAVEEEARREAALIGNAELDAESLPVPSPDARHQAREDERDNAAGHAVVLARGLGDLTGDAAGAAKQREKEENETIRNQFLRA